MFIIVLHRLGTIPDILFTGKKDFECKDIVFIMAKAFKKPNEFSL